MQLDSRYSTDCDSCGLSGPGVYGTLDQLASACERQYWHVDRKMHTTFCPSCMRAYRVVCLALDARLDADLDAQGAGAAPAEPPRPSTGQILVDYAIAKMGQGGEA